MRPILFSSAAVLLAMTMSGCTVNAEPASAPPPPPPAPVAVSQPPPPAPPPPAPPQIAEDDDVVYDAPPPVADIEAYPSVFYGGATVYYVDGIWYRRGPTGWARYRAEPPELGRIRMAHAREGRWAREGAPRPAPPPPGAAQMQRRPAPPPPPGPPPAPPAREVRP